MKIAILDTGIDEDHWAIGFRAKELKKLNCYGSQEDIPDLNGHGTFTASLILDYAPDAELHVVKIADEKDASPNAEIVINVSSYTARSALLAHATFRN